MFGRRGHMRGIGWIAAFAAAYALVFQVVLSSALMASVPPGGGDPLAQLCLSSASSHAQTDEGGKTSKSQAHCPLCLSRTDVAALPPPVATPVIDRIAIELHFRAVLRSSLQALNFGRPFQPRAPPARA